MPIATRTFRVFVSSTFEDLKEERDALQREVFPRLRKLCESHGARFQAIDLRWGVRDEAALDHKTMEICLREIERCQQTGIKPNFIVLLGERYGWRPLPSRIDATEFNTVCSQIPATDKCLIDEWYRCDDNAVPPEFVLNPRAVEFADPDHWTSLEQRLHHILEAAAKNAGLPPEARIKYQASATHQEILKGLGRNEDDRQHVFAYFREGPEDSAPDLKALKDDLEGKLPKGNVHKFQPREIEKLCHDVEEAIKGVILDEVHGFTSRDALELEIEAHDRFAADRSRCFVGRSDALDAIAAYITGSERRPLVLHGASGAGKSAVMAKASDACQGRVIRRFVGASPDSVNGFALLTSLCQQIAPGETPTDYAKLEQAFRDRLAATAEQSLILFIDALDQLAAGDPARAAPWLPAELPPHVKIVVSTTDHETSRPAGFQVPLAPMTPMEGRLALDTLLHEARRTLQDWQRNIVFEHFARCGLPLYLKLAAEESRLWKSFDPPESCRLGEGIAGVIDTLFDRLSSNTNHGQVLVDRSLGFLAAARYGLTETEMLGILASDNAVWSDFNQRKHHEISERRLPVVIWSRLSLDLEPYLTERAAPGGTVVAFYHRQLAERAAGRFLAGDEARHVDLAGYFLREPTWLDNARKNPNARKAAELAFQQRAAQQWTAAEELLFDCQFLIAKTAAGMARDLDEDFELFLQNAPAGNPDQREALTLIHGAVRLSVNVLLSDPRQFASQMVGRLLSFSDLPTIKTFTERITEGAPRPWLRPLYPALHPAGTQLLRTLEGHTREINAVALTANGRRAVSASKDKTLRVWDLDSGRVLHTLEGHTDWVNAVALTADGRRAVSASNDKTLKVWDLHSGYLLRTLEGNTGEVTALALTADGRRVVAGGERTLKVWELDSGRVLCTHEGNMGEVTAVALTADGRRAVAAATGYNYVRVCDLDLGEVFFTLKGHTRGVAAIALTMDGGRAVSASWDMTLIVWNIRTCLALHTLTGHTDGVNAVALTADGSRAVSASKDNTLKVWDLNTGCELRTLEGHTDGVNAVVLTADGSRAISASSDKTIKVWNIETGRVLRTLKGHTLEVSAVALTADGRRAVSASDDHTLKVWDIDSDRVPRTIEGHTDRVTAVALTADGRRAVSASDDQTLMVWDIDSRCVRRTLEVHTGWIDALTLKVDGRRAVSSAWDRFKVWDLETGCLLRTVLVPTVWFKSNAMTADGNLAVSACDDKTLRVWDLETGFILRTLYGHTDWVDAIALMADGHRAVSASSDKTLRVWDLETGAVITTFTCEGAVSCCAFTASNTIVAGDDGGRVHFLRLEEV